MQEPCVEPEMRLTNFQKDELSGRLVYAGVIYGVGIVAWLITLIVSILHCGSKC